MRAGEKREVHPRAHHEGPQGEYKLPVILL